MGSFCCPGPRDSQHCSALPLLQVRKELEVNGIEFYPQKEFDEDLEDKTENDKIRVGASSVPLGRAFRLFLRFSITTPPCHSF